MAFFSSASRNDQFSQLLDQVQTTTAEDGIASASNVGPITIRGGGKKSTTQADVDIVTTDFGAVIEGGKTAREALAFAADVNDVNAALSRDLFGTAAGLGERAFETVADTSAEAFATVEASQQSALEFGGQALEAVDLASARSVDLAGEVSAGVIDFGGGLIDLTGAALKNNADALASAFANTAGGQTQSTQMIVLAALAAAVLIVVLPAVLRKGG